MRSRIPTITGLALLALAAPGARAAEFEVDSTIDAVDAVPGDGLCADPSGACTLRAAVMETNALAGADEIALPPGTYPLAIRGADEDAAATGDLDVTDPLTLVGAGAETTILDAAGIDRVLHVRLTSLSIDSLTITGGRAGVGSGIYCSDCDHLSVNRSTVSGNTGSLSLGAIGAVSSSKLELHVVGSAITDNVDAGLALALFATTGPESEFWVVESTISRNQYGGIVAPVVPFGGLALTGALINTTVSAHHSSCGKGGCGPGPAIWLEGASLSVVNSTVAANDVEGGALFLGSEGSLSMTGTIMANSGGGNANCGDVFSITSYGHNIASDGTCNLTDPTDLSDTDPLLGPLQDNGGPTWTHALLPGSPAIDAIPPADCTWDDDGDPGTPEVPLGTDQRGVARPQGAGCDIGAFEVNTCANGLDDDGDGLVDYPADPGCKNTQSGNERPQCQDALDNDGDGKLDFDGGASANHGVALGPPDPQCTQPWRATESPTPSCGLGAELVALLPMLGSLRRRARGGRAQRCGSEGRDAAAKTLAARPPPPNPS